MKEIIIKPVLTEKSLALAGKGIYTFKVAKLTDKAQIVKAMLDIYHVHATDVHTVSMTGKTHRVGKKMTKIQKMNWKKAMITVKKGETVDAFQVTEASPAKK
jgi:large subunit ribosomal protein L23